MKLKNLLISRHNRNLSIFMRSASTLYSERDRTFVIHATSLHQLKNYVYRILRKHLRNQMDINV